MINEKLKQFILINNFKIIEDVYLKNIDNRNIVRINLNGKDIDIYLIDKTIIFDIIRDYEPTLKEKEPNRNKFKIDALKKDAERLKIYLSREDSFNSRYKFVVENSKNNLAVFRFSVSEQKIEKEVFKDWRDIVKNIFRKLGSHVRFPSQKNSEFKDSIPILIEFNKENIKARTRFLVKYNEEQMEILLNLRARYKVQDGAYYSNITNKEYYLKANNIEEKYEFEENIFIEEASKIFKILRDFGINFRVYSLHVFNSIPSIDTAMRFKYRKSKSSPNSLLIEYLNEVSIERKDKKVIEIHKIREFDEDEINKILDEDQDYTCRGVMELEHIKDFFEFRSREPMERVGLEDTLEYEYTLQNYEEDEEEDSTNYSFEEFVNDWLERKNLPYYYNDKEKVFEAFGVNAGSLSRVLDSTGVPFAKYVVVFEGEYLGDNLADDGEIYRPLRIIAIFS